MSHYLFYEKPRRHLISTKTRYIYPLYKYSIYEQHIFETKRSFPLHHSGCFLGMNNVSFDLLNWTVWVNAKRKHETGRKGGSDCVSNYVLFVHDFLQVVIVNPKKGKKPSCVTKGGVSPNSCRDRSSEVPRHLFKSGSERWHMMQHREGVRWRKEKKKRWTTTTFPHWGSSRRLTAHTKMRSRRSGRCSHHRAVCVLHNNGHGIFP